MSLFTRLHKSTQGKCCANCQFQNGVEKKLIKKNSLINSFIVSVTIVFKNFQKNKGRPSKTLHPKFFLFVNRRFCLPQQSSTIYMNSLNVYNKNKKNFLTSLDLLQVWVSQNLILSTRKAKRDFESTSKLEPVKHLRKLLFQKPCDGIYCEEMTKWVLTQL